MQCTYYRVGVIGIYRHFQHRFTYIMTTRLNLGKSTDRHKEMNGKTTGIGKVAKNFKHFRRFTCRKVRGATLVTRSPRILCFVLVRTYIVSVPFNAATPRTVLVICKFQIHRELTLFLWIFWRIIFGDCFTFSWH